MKKKKTETKRSIESYEHRDKERVNNPPAGLVTPETDPGAGQKKNLCLRPATGLGGQVRVRLV